MKSIHHSRDGEITDKRALELTAVAFIVARGKPLFKYIFNEIGTNKF